MGIPDWLWINKNGVVNILSYSLYVGLRFKNREIGSVVSEDNHAKFFTAHDGELLFSFPLPISVKHCPVRSQINIGHIEGFWHRQPPKIMPQLSALRPSRQKKQ